MFESYYNFCQYFLKTKDDDEENPYHLIYFLKWICKAL